MQEICIFLLGLSEDPCVNMDESPQMQFSEVTRTSWCLALMLSFGRWKGQFETLTRQKMWMLNPLGH